MVSQLMQSIRKKKKVKQVYFILIIILFIVNTSVATTKVSEISNPPSNGPKITSFDYTKGFSTYFGGNLNDVANGITTDLFGNVYVVGYTYSSNFPTKNAYNATFNENAFADAFIAKFNSTGYLVFSTFFGGSNYDNAIKVAVDKESNIYVVGDTYSHDFPTKNAYESLYKGSKDSFLAKFDSNGVLQFSTMLGDSGATQVKGITIDPKGNCWIVGYTNANDFPMKNAFNNTYGAYNDVYISEYDKDGALIYSTYLGSNLDDFVYGITFDSLGNYYVTGSTGGGSFPIINANQSTFGGGTYDAFLTKFNSLNQIVFSTFLGGNSVEEAHDLITDSQNNVYLVGNTQSGNFPVINEFNNTNSGASDIFVAKYNSVGNLTYSTYLGGNFNDYGYSIRLNNQNNIFVFGASISTNFPLSDPIYGTFAQLGYYDPVLTEFSLDGKSLVMSTYFNGSFDDYGQYMDIDTNDNIYLTGHTVSTNFPVNNAYYQTNQGNDDAFIIGIYSQKGPITSPSSSASLISDTSSNKVTTSENLTNNILDQELLKNPVFDSILGVSVLSILMNVILLIRRKK